MNRIWDHSEHVSWYFSFAQNVTVDFDNYMTVGYTNFIFNILAAKISFKWPTTSDGA